MGDILFLNFSNNAITVISTKRIESPTKFYHPLNVEKNIKLHKQKDKAIT